MLLPAIQAMMFLRQTAMPVIYNASTSDAATPSNEFTLETSAIDMRVSAWRHAFWYITTCATIARFMAQRWPETPLIRHSACGCRMVVATPPALYLGPSPVCSCGLWHINIPAWCHLGSLLLHAFHAEAQRDVLLDCCARQACSRALQVRQLLDAGVHAASRTSHLLTPYGAH